MKRRLLAVVMVIALIFCAGCAGGGETPQGGEDDNVITVSSAKDFVEAIAPNVTIKVEPGYYNLSKYIEGAWAKDGESWNDAHKYVKIEECFDGVMLKVIGVSGLNIVGDIVDEEKSEIVVEPRYADVLKFTNCNDLYIEKLTVGHTDTGYCVGNVISLYDCDGIDFEKVDLYGCGVIGIYAENCGDLEVNNGFIHDCSYLAMEITGQYGKCQFNHCDFSYNDYGFSFYDNDCTLLFTDCYFDQNESNSISFMEGVELIDCTVQEPTEYPDYSDEDYDDDGELDDVDYDAEPVG